ncbi:MAG TPA: PQQ-dependent sugar dehydrogenase [Nitrososphaeraceae archaeon]|nr:PQQ-dependent sugar dehydrogenase [Nitrososphaeraceae archaeon]
MLSIIFLNDSTYATEKECIEFQCKYPIINDPNLQIEIIYQGNDFEQKGLNQLSPVTMMKFLGDDDILLLNKNDGKVLRILDGKVLPEPLLDVNVANKWERGLLGIAVSKNDDKTHVFLYYTESKEGDGEDICLTVFCAKPKEPIQNKLYRYDLINNKLVNPKLLFAGPKSNIASHIGGALEVGPDNNVYLLIGDFHGYQQEIETLAQNYINGSFPDGRSGILRFTQDGKPVGDGILGKKYPLNLYYAYGIRNGYGLDFDPLSGKLWDTENGPDYGDEINLVEPGFNSGWNRIQGIWQHRNREDVGKTVIDKPSGIVNFGAVGKYSTPKITWNESVAPTALNFLNSDNLGKKYENDLFVASFKLGIIYHFDLDKDRTTLTHTRTINVTLPIDKESRDFIFARDVGKITDMEVGPDGRLYVLSTYYNKPTIFKIS